MRPGRAGTSHPHPYHSCLSGKCGRLCLENAPHRQALPPYRRYHMYCGTPGKSKMSNSLYSPHSPPPGNGLCSPWRCMPRPSGPPSTYTRPPSATPVLRLNRPGSPPAKPCSKNHSPPYTPRPFLRYPPTPSAHPHTHKSDRCFLRDPAV